MRQPGCHHLVLTSILGLTGISPQLQAATLVGYWSLNEGTGTTAADTSGNMLDGTLTGGTPKYVEITNTGLTDFTFAEGGLIIQSNLSNDLTIDVNLTGVTAAAGASFVMVSDNQDGDAAFVSVFGFAADLVSPFGFGNGNDRYILTSTADSSVMLDGYGEDGVDGTGAVWEYIDSYAYRLPAFAAGKGLAFDPAEWDIAPVGTLTGVGEAGIGEDCVSCPADCNGVQGGRPNNRYCCGDGGGQNPLPCSSTVCSSGGWQCTDDPVSGGSYCCGDLVCESEENSDNCSLDCGAAPFCGDGFCDPGEDECNCAGDCGAPPATETNCTDGVDEDCDGGADCNDPTGDCDAHPSCASSCGNGICESGENCNTCSSDCDGIVNGPPSGRYCCGNGILEGPEGDGRCDGNP